MGKSFQRFAAGDVQLQSGQVLRKASLAYQTYGTLNAMRDNAVVLPSYYTGNHGGYEPMIGPGNIFDTRRYFIVAPNLFGNGLSTSPSNATPAQRGADFPLVTVYDNVACQQRLLAETFGIESVRLVAGWSMGASQAFHWAAAYPKQVAAILPWCGAARCSPHNWLFLDGVKAALQADPVFAGGRYRKPPVAGLKAFAHVYCGWAFSQTFFRRALYRELGFASIAGMLEAWEEEHLAWDANNLLSKLATWQHTDLGHHPDFDGDFARALGAIRARAIVMPCRSDLYFPPEDSVLEVAAMANAQLRVIESHWGHCAGGPGRNAPDMRVLDAAVQELLR